MNPIASIFVPSGRLTTYGSDEATITLQALARSLAAEQHAHHATQIALEDSLSRVKELEGDMKKIEKQNKSLVSAVNMLGGIIKHNQHKVSRKDLTPTKLNSSVEEVKAEPEEPVHQMSPIVYDVLAKQLAEKEGRNCTEVEVASVADSLQVNEAGSTTDDTDLFNLELLQSPEREETAGSALCRTLRRHFFESPEMDNTGRLSRVATPLQSTDKLISVSPDDKRSDNKYTSFLAASPRLQQKVGNISATPTKMTTQVIQPQSITIV